MRKKEQRWAKNEFKIRKWESEMRFLPCGTQNVISPLKTNLSNGTENLYSETSGEPVLSVIHAKIKATERLLNMHFYLNEGLKQVRGFYTGSAKENYKSIPPS